MPLTPFDTLRDQLEVARAELLEHPVYATVDDLEALRCFMRSHVFAVWDFMSLLKSLQRRLTCVEVPWLPPAEARSARMINEIVLGEESDEVSPGRVTSHFDLYLAAMGEVGADATPMARFLSQVRLGAPASAALEPLSLPPETAAFVRATLRTATEGAHHEVAAAFLFGREDLVPAMFRRLLAQLGGPEAAGRHPSFCAYLERHILVDEEHHGPLGRLLLETLCGSDPLLWHQAGVAASAAIEQRHQLWDGVLAEVQQLRRRTA